MLSWEILADTHSIQFVFSFGRSNFQREKPDWRNRSSIKHIIVIIIFIVSWDDAQIWYVYKGLQVRSHKSLRIWRIISM